MSDYKLIPITELLSDIIDNRGKSCPTQESGFPLIATNCIKHSSIYPTFENIRYVSEETRNNWFRAELKPNDILFVNKGTPGRVCLVPDPITFCAAQDMVGLRANPDKIYYKYLFAILRSTFIQQKIANFHVGIAIPHFKKSDMDKLLIPVPDMKLQIEIGDMYCQLSEKIEINNRINAELESMAKTIYDYWFTQFDFPDENGKPYKSSGGKMVWNEELKREIPEGWEVVSFSDLVSFEKGKIPEQLFEDKTGISFSPYLTIDVVNGGQSQYCATDKMPYCNGETIMVMDGAASGDVYVGNKGVLGSTFAMLKPKNQSYSNAMIYRMLRNNEIIYKKANTGSTVPHANRKFIEAMRIAVPTNIELFSKTFDTIQAKIEKCKEENQQLASLRDWLLPMLMNGQVGFEGIIDIAQNGNN